MLDLYSVSMSVSLSAKVIHCDVFYNCILSRGFMRISGYNVIKLYSVVFYFITEG